MVAAGAADGHHGRSAARDDVVYERGSRALARLKPVGVVVYEVEHFDAGADGGALLREEYAFAERAAAGGGADEVAVAVDAGDMGCAAAVAGVAGGYAREHLGCGVRGLADTGVFPRIARGGQFGAGARGVNQAGALGGVLFGCEAVYGDGGEVGVSVVRLAVSECQLARLQDGVDVGGGVMPHFAQVEVFQDVEDLECHNALRPSGVAADFVSRKG